MTGVASGLTSLRSQQPDTGPTRSIRPFGRDAPSPQLRDSPSPMSCPDETALVFFLEGRLGGAAVAEVDAHLATCAACRELVAASAAAVLAPASQVAQLVAGGATAVPAPTPAPAVLPRGATVGRYVILGLVGQGGMGDVYAAYDPELDRRIALKLLNDGGATSESQARSRGRLLREARSIARLAHPNVVVVHDAGTIGGRVFIAMEFIEGQTLGAWLGGKPRAWPEIRAIFLAAGRGLAAAHTAGIVHRDFKPHNVMVAANGAVRVTDFGLASDAASPGDPSPPTPDRDHTDFARTTSVATTRTGALVGTPAYMAPEQFRGESSSARTDQYSFCVTLYEALNGERPFTGDSLGTLAEAVTTGRLREPSQATRVPAWLRKVVLRGLSVKREDRFPDMEALLAALTRDPERQRRRILVGAAVAGVLLAGGALGQRAFQKPGAALCGNAGDRLATIWETPQKNSTTSHPRRDAVRAAFLATGARRADDVWQRVAAILDAYAKRWTATHAEACEATHVRGEQSTEVLDLRMDCLNGSRDSLRTLVDVFATADAEMVGNAIDAAIALPDLARCSDAAVLRSVPPPPRDPKLRQQVDSLRHRAAEARTLGNAGRWKEAIARTNPLLDEAEKLGYQPVVAELAALLAGFHVSAENLKLGVEGYEHALSTATEARYDEVAAQAAVMLVYCLGFVFDQPEEGERWARFAEAILKRMGPGHDRLRAWLLNNRAPSRAARGQTMAAESDLLEAIALKRKADGGDSADVAQSIVTLAEIHARRGDYASAVDLAGQGRAIFDRVYGPDGIFSARLYSNRCEYLNGLGRYDEALESCAKAIAIFQTELEPDHGLFGYPLTAKGIALMGLHRPDEALAPLRRALEIRRREPIALERGETWFALARAQWDTGGDRAAARAAAESARDDYAKAAGGDAKVRAVNSWLAAHTVDRRR